MTDGPRFGAAVIGLGVGQQHARAYRDDDRAELRWLCDQDGERVEQVLAELGAGAAACDLATVLADPEVEVVSLATYDADHGAQVSAALAAGKHVFCEKPLCTTRADLERIGAFHGDRRVCLATNLVLRAAPLYRWLREAVASGELGRIYAFDGDYLYGRLHKIVDSWRGRQDQYSVMLGGGVHLIDLMLWLTGERPQAVSAVGNRIATSETTFRYDDFAAATFQFESGLVGRITANFGCVHRHQHALRLFGTEATVLIDDAGPRIHRSRDPESAASALELDPLPPSKAALIPGFLAAVAGEAELEPSTAHELAVIAASLAADESRAHGEQVRIRYL